MLDLQYFEKKLTAEFGFVKEKFSFTTLRIKTTLEISAIELMFESDKVIFTIAYEGIVGILDLLYELEGDKERRSLPLEMLKNGDERGDNLRINYNIELNERIKLYVTTLKSLPDNYFQNVVTSW